MNSDKPRFEVLEGLPSYGPMAEAFSETGSGTHREGFVVRFYPAVGDPWVGNFQPGITSFHTVEAHPDGCHVIVISGGQGYIIDPNSRKSVEFIGGWYNQSMRVGDILILVTPIDFEAIGPEGRRWQTRRVSWDEMRNIQLNSTGCAITGEAWTWVNDDWIPFELDIRSGAVKGGSYNEPE